MIQSEALHAVLAPLVAGRCWPVMFPLTPLPDWPAIRYTPVGGTVHADACGGGDGLEDDPTVQIDCVATTYLAAQNLAQQVRAAMQTFSPPAVPNGAMRADYDPDTKTHRTSQDYTLYPSSSAS